jgi:hypothetical protein
MMWFASAFLARSISTVRRTGSHQEPSERGADTSPSGLTRSSAPSKEPDTSRA